MKKTLFLCLIMILGACSKDETESVFELSDQSLLFSSFEGSNTLGIRASGNWEILAEVPDWCSIDKLSGNGISTISIKVLTNTNKQKRSFELNVKSGAQIISLIIEQSANNDEDLLIVSPTEFVLTSLGQEIKLSIEANNDWEIKNIPAWCKVNTVNGESGKNDIAILVEANTVDKEREVQLTIASGKLNKTIRIYQEEFLPNNVLRLKEAGTLKSELERRNMTSVTDLVIYGKMNGDDFGTIRKLEGLLSLDISKVQILESYSKIEYTVNSEAYSYWHVCKANVIPEAAFLDLRSVESIKLPPLVSNIEDRAFEGCSSLKQVTIPETIKELSTNMFSGCSSLRSIDFPSKLEVIGERAFASCESLSDIKFHSNIKEIRFAAFAYCTSLISVIIPDNITILGDGAFTYCKSLKTVKISNRIKSLTYTFMGCESLENVDLPPLLESLESQTFGGCKSLKSIKLPKTLSRLGSMVFYNCSSLKEIHVLNSNPPTISTFYPEAAFHGFNSSSFILYIPKGSKATYASSSWRFYFKDLVEF